MAGTRAGFMYQTFPLMNGVFFPNTALASPSFLDSLLNNVDMIQFIHRSLGWLILALGTVVAIGCFRRAETGRQRTVGLLLGVLLLVQFGLGITVVLVDGIPPLMGASHQLGAFLLVSTTLALIHGCYGHQDGSDGTESLAA